jgi:hypothetical protein
MKKKIYESPDKGKTIYERNFGDYDHRKLIIKGGKLCQQYLTESKSGKTQK